MITYSPEYAGNSTNSFFMLPGAAKKISLSENSKVYFANNRQIGIVMSGESIDEEKPDFIIHESDEGKVLKVHIK